jgi:uncharacterized protein (DUF2267 family)
MVCRLCGQRRARRACPALDHEICAFCCGTKRLVEIQCPSDCPYLASAREHPPATLVRQQQRDLGLAMQLMRDFNQRQSQLFFLITTFLVRYNPPELHTLVDDDVAEAAAALAATFETAVRGVIYEHRATSAPAARLAAALAPVLAQAGQQGGTPFQRDAAIVLRRLEETARHGHGVDRENPRAVVELLGRVIRKADETAPAAPGEVEEPSRVIVP